MPPSFEDILYAERRAYELRNQEMARLLGVLWSKIVGLFGAQPTGERSASA